MDEHLVGAGSRRHCGLGFFEARNHAGKRAKATHILHLLQLHPQVVHVELTLGHLGRELFGILDFDCLRGTLDERYHIAHSKDAARDTAGMKQLEPVKLLARANKLDRFACHSAHRQRSTAACIAIHARQDNARKRHLISEAFGDVYRVLTGQTINNK